MEVALRAQTGTQKKMNKSITVFSANPQGETLYTFALSSVKDCQTYLRDAIEHAVAKTAVFTVDKALIDTEQVLALLNTAAKSLNNSASQYDRNFSVRPDRYLAVVNNSCEVLYSIDLGNCSHEDINELSAYMSYTFIESNARVLFGKGVEIGKPIQMRFEHDRYSYFLQLLKEWTASRNKDRTLEKIEAKKPKTESKYKRINKKILNECKALRDSGKSWSDITTLLREYDPILLKSKGMAYIAKHNLTN